MSVRPAILAALCLPAAACGQSQPAQPKPAIVVRSPEQDQLHKLDELNRAIALKRALYASGYRCSRIERSGYVTQVKNLDMWAAHCSDGRDWAIFTGPDASVQVRDCEDVARFGLPACDIKPSPDKPG
jgi:hypothetical protein